MAGKVYFSVTMSLDGFVAPEEGIDEPGVQRWTVLPVPGGGCSRADRRAHRKSHEYAGLALLTR